MPSTADDTQPTSFSDPSLSWEPMEPAEGSSPSETPAADAPAASSPEPATSAPVETPREGDGVSQTPGPIPYDRHKSVLDSAYKERDEFKGKYESLSWAEKLAARGYKPEQFEQAAQFADLAGRSPREFLAYYQRQVAQHPEYAAELKSWAAGVLGQAKQQADENAEPQPDLVSEDGKRVFSHEQLKAWNGWNERRLMGAFDAKLAPLLKLQEEHQQAIKDEEARVYYRDAAQAEVSALKAQPLFMANLEKVKTYMASLDYKVSPEKAWLHVLHTDILPGIGHTAQAQATADMRKLAAASSVNPSAATPSTPAVPRKLTDPSLWR